MIRLNFQYFVKFGFKGEFDICLFMFNVQGKVSGDFDFIFYNNLFFFEGVVRFVIGLQQVSIEIVLDCVLVNVSKIVIIVVIDGEDIISGFSLLSIQVSGIVDFQVEIQGCSEKVIILGEVYWYNGVWKFCVLGQGFNGGFEFLVINYGVDVVQLVLQLVKFVCISLEKKLEI